jgi:GNAT superfamily N-acetyltransferase
VRRLLNNLWRYAATFSRPTREDNLRRLRSRGESLESVTMREAVPADISALARLHVLTWNATYAPLLLNGPGVGVRERQWTEAFAAYDGSWFCYVLQRPDGELVGFAKGRRSDNPSYGGELNKIYLLAEYQRLGLGRRLVAQVARRFLDEGVHSMWLSGDARNPSSRAWLALGAHHLDDKTDGGNFGWHDLPALIARCERKS